MSTRLPRIEISRVYGATFQSNTAYVLIDRIWPRGVKKEDLKYDLWAKDLAPSTELRKWFNHDPERWTEFRERYRQELKEHQDTLDKVLALAHQKPLVLLYAAKDEEHNNAVALREYLLKHDKGKPAS